MTGWQDELSLAHRSSCYLVIVSFMFAVSVLYLRRKLTFHASGRTLVLVKRSNEMIENRLMMALLWALYLPQYPSLRIDVPIGARYRPDLVELGADGRPVFWGECGEVGLEKLGVLCARYRETHLV